MQAMAPTPSRSKRPYNRKGNPQPINLVFPTSPPQLSEFAINVHGWALEEGMQNRAVFEVINAYNPTMIKGGFEGKIKELRAGGFTDIYRNDLQYTARELDAGLAERDSSISQYLVVGYTLQEEDPIFVNNRNFSRYSENELVGETQPSEQNLIKWDTCRTPVLVVTPIKENTGTSVRLFGLIQQTSGLCQPVLLTHERIFYRWEYRASAGAKPTQRNKNWNQLIVQKAKELTPIDNAARDEDVKPKRAKKTSQSRGTVKQERQELAQNDIPEAREPGDLQGDHFELSLVLDSLLKPAVRTDCNIVNVPRGEPWSSIKIVLSPDTRAIVTGIRASRTDRVIEEIRFVLTKVEMPKEIPLDKTVGLQHFVSVNSPFGFEDAQVAVNEIEALWPELALLVDVNKIARMKAVMNYMNLTVGLETMAKFFSNTLAYLATNPHVTDETLALKLVEYHHLACVLVQAHRSIAVNRGPAGVDAIFLITLLRDLLRYDNYQNNAMRQDPTQNRIAMPSAFACHSFEYFFSFDVAERSQELDDTVQELFKHAKDKNCGIEDIVLWLERLRLRIRQA